jgi:uncharacterized phage infection (PIP) family protein YhgE
VKKSLIIFIVILAAALISVTAITSSYLIQREHSQSNQNNLSLELQALMEEKTKLEEELRQVQEELQQVQEQLRQTQEELKLTQKTLQQTQGQMQEMQEKLQERLQQMESELQKRQEELQKKQEELQQLSQTLNQEIDELKLKSEQIIQLMEQQLTVPESFFESNKNRSRIFLPSGGGLSDILITKIHISPHEDCKEGEIQAFKIWVGAQESQIKEVTATIETNAGNVTVQFKLINGTLQEGEWVGFWLIRNMAGQTDAAGSYTIWFRMTSEAEKATLPLLAYIKKP